MTRQCQGSQQYVSATNGLFTGISVQQKGVPQIYAFEQTIVTTTETFAADVGHKSWQELGNKTIPGACLSAACAVEVDAASACVLIICTNLAALPKSGERIQR